MFHLDIVEGKNKLFEAIVSCELHKNYCYVWFHELYLSQESKIIFLNQRLDFRDSNPNSWYGFSDDVPLIAPVITRQALY